jgi:hypothetical protein
MREVCEERFKGLEYHNGVTIRKERVGANNSCVRTLIDLRFSLFYCLFMLGFFFIFALYRLFCVSFLLPFSPFLFGFFIAPLPPFSPLFFGSYGLHL